MNGATGKAARTFVPTRAFRLASCVALPFFSSSFSVSASDELLLSELLDVDRLLTLSTWPFSGRWGEGHSLSAVIFSYLDSKTS